MRRLRRKEKESDTNRGKSIRRRRSSRRKGRGE
jgi:hypothetical protein